jgi:hypothetical protein
LINFILIWGECFPVWEKYSGSWTLKVNFYLFLMSLNEDFPWIINFNVGSCIISVYGFFFGIDRGN